MGLFTDFRPSSARVARAASPAVWIVEDEPDAAALACDLAALSNASARAFRDHRGYLAALDREPAPALVVLDWRLDREPAPALVVLDWRLDRELASPVFLATRHRYPKLPVVVWTGSRVGELPEMVRTDPNTRIACKADGLPPLELALRWGLETAGRARQEVSR